MALATSTFSFLAATIGDVDPWAPGNVTALNGTARIASGVFRGNTVGSLQRFRYSGAVSGTTMRVSMRINAGGDYNEQGVGFLDASGNGYFIGYRWGALFRLLRVDAGVVTEISAGEQEMDPDGASVDAILHLDINTATGALAVLIENPNGVPAITVPTGTGIFATDTTYSVGLAPALVFKNDDGGFVINAWGADAGGGGSAGNASGTVGAATAEAPSGSASVARSVSVTLRNGAGTLLNTVARRFWTRTTLDAAAADGGAGGLSVTCNGVGVFNLTGLSIGAGAGWLTYKDPADDLNCHTVPVIFA